MTLTSRKCPQCGNEVTQTARFCAECGSSMIPAGLSSTPMPQSGSPGFAQPHRDASPHNGAPPLAPTIRTEPPTPDNSRTIIGVLIGAVVLLSVLVAVLAGTLRHANSASAQPCVAEPSLAPLAQAGAGEAHLPSPSSISPNPPATTPTEPAKPAESTAPSTTAATSTTTTTASTAATPASTATTATTAVTDAPSYLKFLQGVDQKRLSLLASTTAPDGSTSPNAPQPADWQALINSVQTQTVPDAFSGFNSDYLTFLNDCASSAGKPDQASQIQAEASRLDSEFDRLCQTQNVPKPFTIAMTQPSTNTAPANASTPPAAQ